MNDSGQSGRHAPATSSVEMLSGADLDAAVARALGWERARLALPPDLPVGKRGPIGWYVDPEGSYWHAFKATEWLESPLVSDFEPSRDWEWGGWVIEKMTDGEYARFRLSGSHYHGWYASAQWPEGEVPSVFGETALIAAMRCFVDAEARAKGAALSEPTVPDGHESVKAG